MMSGTVHAVLLFGFFLLAAEPSSGAEPDSRLSLAVDRTWQDGDTGYVLVTVVNSTKKPASSIKVRCVALDASGKRINVGEKYLVSPGEELEPGGSETRRIKIPLYGAKIADATCKAKAFPILSRGFFRSLGRFFDEMFDVLKREEN